MHMAMKKTRVKGKCCFPDLRLNRTRNLAKWTRPVVARGNFFMKTCFWILMAGYYVLAIVGSVSAQEKRMPLKVCLVSGSLEYDSDSSLSLLQKYLENNDRVICSRAFRKTDGELPGLESLDTSDVMVLFTRRLTIDGEQLERVKKYCLAGKPVVGIRTASHAFQKWLELDKIVFGGNYQNHYPAGSATVVEYTDKGRDHPILVGVKLHQSAGTLQKHRTRQGRGRSPHRQHSRAYRTNRLDARFYGWAGVLHVARPPARFPGRELCPHDFQCGVLDRQ
jgi:hypothetical protein